MMKYCTNCGNPLNENDQFCQRRKAAVRSAGETPVQVASSAPTFSVMGFKDNFWVRGLRRWGWFLFIVALIISVIVSYLASYVLWRLVGPIKGVIVFIVVFLLCALVGFLIVATTMIFVEMASDIAKIRYMFENR